MDVLFFEKTVFIASSSVYRQILKEIENFNINNFNAIKKNLIVDWCKSNDKMPMVNLSWLFRDINEMSLNFIFKS